MRIESVVCVTLSNPPNHSVTEADLLLTRLIYICIASLLSTGLYMLSKRLQRCRGVETSEVTDDMCPVDGELLRSLVQSDFERRQSGCSDVSVEGASTVSGLEETIEKSRQFGIHMRSRRLNAVRTRREIRVSIDRITIHVRRILQNIGRCGCWAGGDWRDCSAEVVAKVSEILKTEYEARWLARRVLIKIWLWNMTEFYRLSWELWYQFGLSSRAPAPSLQWLNIEEVLNAYERVKGAAIGLADYLGEKAVAEKLATSM